MLTLTSPIETRWHALPAGVKLLGLALATMLIVALKIPMMVGGAVAVVMLFYLTEGLAFAGYGLRMLRPLWPFIAVLAIWHGVTGAWGVGLIIAGKMLAAVGLANLVTMTTRLDDMIAVVERAARPLSRIGLSPRTLAVSIALVVRFTPVLFEKIGHLSDAWKARRAGRPNWRLVLPSLLVALDDAEHVAEALRARGGL